MFKPQYKQLINVDGIELKPSNVRKIWSIVTASSFAFSAFTSRFPQLVKCDTDVVASSCLPIGLWDHRILIEQVQDCMITAGQSHRSMVYVTVTLLLHENIG